MIVPVGAADVAGAARAVLQQHLPAVLAAGLRPVPAPTKYDAVPTFEAIRKVNRSVLAVSVPRTIGQPRHYSDGFYDITWLLSIAVWHEQTTALPLLTAASDYTAGVRETFRLHRDLGGLALELEFTGESIDLVGDERTTRTLGLGICEFAVRVPSHAETAANPTPTGPVVQTTDVTITRTSS